VGTTRMNTGLSPVCLDVTPFRTGPGVTHFGVSSRGFTGQERRERAAPTRAVWCYGRCGPGMSETTAIVTALIIERPLCVSCISAKAGLTERGVNAALARVETVLVLHRRDDDRCRACGSTGAVVSLDRPAERHAGDIVPAPRSAASTARARVAAWVSARSGEPWCAECVAAKLDLPRGRVANVFLAAEGMPGFRREDRRCVACGRRRLTLAHHRAGP